MEEIILKAKVREAFGKGPCGRLRKSGEVPSVVYRGGSKALSVQVDRKTLWHALHTEAGENAIITLDISGLEKDVKKTVIVREVQSDPLNDELLHVDFNEISLKEKIKVKVPIAVKGEAIGVKEEEGIVTQEIWEIEVECLPTDIPDQIIVQVDNLHIGEGIHVKDIVPPKGVTLLADLEQTIVSVVLPQKEEVVEEVKPEEAAEPEVIKKGKKEEEEVPGEEGAPGKEEEKPAPGGAEKTEKKG